MSIEHCVDNIRDLAISQKCRQRMKSSRVLRLVDSLIVRIVDNIRDLAISQKCRQRMKSSRMLRLVDSLIVRIVVPSLSSLHLDCLTMMIKAQ